MNRKSDIVPFWIYSDILDKVMTMVDNFDSYTKNHCLRVGVYTGLFLRYLQENDKLTEELKTLSQNDLKDIVYAGFVHDIGKTTVYADIIKQKKSLSEEDWKEVETHPQTGAFFFLAPGYENIRDGILMHHERFDGKGYPFGFAGKEISVVGRIVAILDSFDAMTDRRPYVKKPPLNLWDALREIARCSGTQFDPELAKLFIEMCMSEKYQNILTLKENKKNFNRIVENYKEWIHSDDNDFELKMVFDHRSHRRKLIKEKKKK